MTQYAFILDLSKVAIRPIGQIDGIASMVRFAARDFHKKTFHRAQGIMVNLGQPIAWRGGILKYVGIIEQGGAPLPSTQSPLSVLSTCFGRCTPSWVLLVQRLVLHSSAFSAAFVNCSTIGLSSKPKNTCVPKHPPRNYKTIRISGSRHQILDLSSTCMDIQEPVNVCHKCPIPLCKDRMPLRFGQNASLNRFCTTKMIAFVMNNTKGCQSI
jgi:hypothetical protein